jgi:hypothetical protein
MEPRSLKEYPKATKIEIPLTERVAKMLFYKLPNPYFGDMGFVRYWMYDINQETLPLKSWTQIDLTTRDEFIPPLREPQTVELLLSEEPWNRNTLRNVARIHGEINGSDRRLVITLLVPVPSLHERSIRFLDQFRFFANGHYRTQPDTVDENIRKLMKSLEEIEQMEKVLVSKGLAPDAAHDQAVKALMPADVQKLLRPDSLGGNAEDRKKAAQMMAEVRRAKMKFGGRKTRRKAKKV